MAEQIVFPEYEYPFEYSDSFGVYACSTLGGSFELKPDAEYIVIWDGVRYERTGFCFVFADGSECVGIGNPLAAGQTSNGDLFCIAYDKTHEINHFLSLEQTDSHTVAIYALVEEELDVVLSEASRPFTYSSDLQLYYASAVGAFVLSEDDTYCVVWDGASYTCKAYGWNWNGIYAVFLGNEAIIKGESTNVVEPFTIWYIPRNGYCTAGTYDPAESHTVGIYRVATDVPEDPALQNGIILRDYKGDETVEIGVEGLIVDTPDGGTKLFVDADTVPEGVETTVELNFSGGPMEVVPAAGQAFSKVTIPVPAGLAPENIPEGLDVAGIIGTMVAGSGGSVKIAYGTVVGANNYPVVTHALGVKPDIILGGAEMDNMPTGTFKLLFACGWSNELAEMMGTTLKGWYCRHESSSTRVSGTTSEFGILTPANETTFQFGNGSQKLDSGKIYRWIAIGGLT